MGHPHFGRAAVGTPGDIAGAGGGTCGDVTGIGVGADRAGQHADGHIRCGIAKPGLAFLQHAPLEVVGAGRGRRGGANSRFKTRPSSFRRSPREVTWYSAPANSMRKGRDIPWSLRHNQNRFEIRDLTLSSCLIQHARFTGFIFCNATD